MVMIKITIRFTLLLLIVSLSTLVLLSVDSIASDKLLLSSTVINDNNCNNLTTITPNKINGQAQIQSLDNKLTSRSTDQPFNNLSLSEQQAKIINQLTIVKRGK